MQVESYDILNTSYTLFLSPYFPPNFPVLCPEGAVVRNTSDASLMIDGSC